MLHVEIACSPTHLLERPILRKKNFDVPSPKLAMCKSIIAILYIAYSINTSRPNGYCLSE